MWRTQCLQQASEDNLLRIYYRFEKLRNFHGVKRNMLYTDHHNPAMGLVYNALTRLRVSQLMPLAAIITYGVMENTQMQRLWWDFVLVLPATNYTKGKRFNTPLTQNYWENRLLFTHPPSVNRWSTVQCIKRPLATQSSSHSMQNLATAHKNYLPAN